MLKPSLDDSGPWGPRAASAARVAYVAVLLSATLLPFRLDLAAGEVLLRAGRALDPELSARAALDAARNVALFTGWGALWALTAARDDQRGAVAAATATGAGLSLSVEAAQLVTPTRTASVLDVAANGAGAWLGAVAAVSLVGALARRRTRYSYLGVPAVLLAAGYLGACLVEAVLPLGRSQVVAGAAGGVLSRVGASLAAFDWSSTPFPLLEGLLFVPAGVAGGLALREAGLGPRRGGRAAAAGGAAAMLLVEGARSVVGMSVEPGAALVHAAGVAAGAWLCTFLLREARRVTPRERAGALVLAWAGLLVLWTWRPFVPVGGLEALAAQLEPDRLVPLSAHAAAVELTVVGDVLRQALLYLPLGALLAAWPLRRRGPLAHVLPVLYLAAGLEVGQLLVAARFPDLTDLLVACGAAGLGWAALRRAGYGVRGELLGSRR